MLIDWNNPIKSEKLRMQEIEMIITEAESLTLQEKMGSGAQVEGLALHKSKDADPFKEKRV